MVLLAVDCQKALVTDHLLRSKLFIQNVKDMIAAARKNHVEVIYVIHEFDVLEGKSRTTQKKNQLLYITGSSVKKYDI